MSVFSLENVFYDENSDYSFDKLNESMYIESIILNLKSLLGERFEHYCFYIFSNHLLIAKPQSLLISSEKKKVLLFFSDEKARNPTYLSQHYFAVFKAYLGKEKHGENIFPLGIGYVKDVPKFDIKPINERSLNIFFSGNLNKNRIDFYRCFSPFKMLLPSQRILNSSKYRKFLLMLKSNFNNYFPNSLISFNSSFKSGFSPHDYGKLLADCKIILSPKGFGRTECFRLYEALRVGCVIISETLPDIYFYKNSPIIQVENWNVGLKLVKELIDNPEKLERMQVEGLEWWDQRCSEHAMATFIIRNLEFLEKKK